MEKCKLKFSRFVDDIIDGQIDDIKQSIDIIDINNYESKTITFKLGDCLPHLTESEIYGKLEYFPVKVYFNIQKENLWKLNNMVNSTKLSSPRDYKFDLNINFKNNLTTLVLVGCFFISLNFNSLMSNNNEIEFDAVLCFDLVRQIKTN